MSDRDIRERAAGDRFADWDAAYVLGALPPADRRAYEEHLADCPACSAALSDLAGIPGLLSTLKHDEALGLLDEEEPDAPNLLPSLVRKVNRRRHLRRWSAAGAVLAAAIIAAVIAFVTPALFTGPVTASVATSLQQVGPQSPTSNELSADVTLTPKKWGTSIDMVCWWKEYAETTPSAQAKRWGYGLWVIARDGTTDRVSTWTAGPGDVVRTTDSTSIPVKDITRIELRTLATGKVLLATSVTPSSAPTPAPTG